MAEDRRQPDLSYFDRHGDIELQQVKINRDHVAESHSHWQMAYLCQGVLLAY